VRRARLAGLVQAAVIWRPATAGESRIAAARPSSVSGTSVRPVCRPALLHSVAPCLIKISSPIAKHDVTARSDRRAPASPHSASIPEQGVATNMDIRGLSTSSGCQAHRFDLYVEPEQVACRVAPLTVASAICKFSRLQGLPGYSSFGAVVSWVPLFIFVFLFGISMDYHVFILSRIRELRARGASMRDAVVGGVAGSAGVVTSAAVIMVAVFSVLATLSIVQTKMLGVGLAAAVLIDATVVRGVLLPAALSLLGERAWSGPGRPRRARDS
jgi:MMPL family